MKFTSHPFKSDTLTLTKQDLFRLERGEELQVSALVIRMEKEPKPDYIKEMDVYINRLYSFYPNGIMEQQSLDGHFSKLATMALTFDGETNELKNAEVI